MIQHITCHVYAPELGHSSHLLTPFGVACFIIARFLLKTSPDPPVHYQQ